MPGQEFWNQIVKEGMGNDQRAAVGRAMEGYNSVGQEAERAANSAEIGAATGMNPALIYGDYDNFMSQRNQQMNNEVVSGNPKIQQYINDNPLAKHISAGDWGNLDRISEAMKVLHPEGLSGNLEKSADPPKTTPGEFIAGIWNGYTERFKQEGRPLEQAISESLPSNWSPLMRAAYSSVGYLPDLAMATINAAFSGDWIGQAVERGAHQAGLDTLTSWVNSKHIPYLDEFGTSKQLGRDIATLFQEETSRNTGRLGQVEDPEAVIGHVYEKETNPFLPKQKPVEIRTGLQAAKPFVDASRRIPTGITPWIDRLAARQATREAEAFNNVVAATRQQTTSDLGPGGINHLQKFFELHPDVRISIDREGIDALYGDTAIPKANDPILGFVPDLQEQVRRTRSSGSDVNIPRSLFLANVKQIPPEAFNTFEEHLRLRPGQMTLAEAKQFDDKGFVDTPTVSPAPVSNEGIRPEDGFIALHASPYSFTKFSKDNQGKGASGAAFGEGTAYVGQEEDVINSYFGGFRARPRYLIVGGKEYPIRPSVDKIRMDYTPEQEAAHILGHTYGTDVDAAIREVKADYPRYRADPIVKILEDWQSKGVKVGDPYVYKVHVRRPEEQFLDWDKSPSEQSPYVKERLQSMADDLAKTRPDLFPANFRDHILDWKTGEGIYNLLANDVFNYDKRKASDFLHSYGIAGNKYLDQGSRVKPSEAELSRWRQSVKSSQALLDRAQKNVEEFTKARDKEELDPTLARQSEDFWKKEVSAHQGMLKEAQDRVDRLERLARGEGTRNFVVFHPNDLHIVAKASGDVFQQAIDRLREATGLNMSAHIGWDQIMPADPGRNIIPATAVSGKTTPGLLLRGPTGEFATPISHFKLKDIIPALDDSMLTKDEQTLSAFVRKWITREAGDTPVYTLSNEDISRLLPNHKLPAGEEWGGYHFQDSVILNHNVVDGTKPAWVQTHIVLHEAIHAATVQAIEQGRYKSIKLATRQLMDHVWSNLTPEQRDDFAYAFTNEREFWADGLSLTGLRSVLKTMDLDPKIHASLIRHLGLEGRPSTMWDAFKALVKQMLVKMGLREAEAHTVMDAMLGLGEAVSTVNKEMRDERWAFAPMPSPARQPKQLEMKGVTRLQDRPLFARGAITLNRDQYERLTKWAREKDESDLQFIRDQLAKEEEARQSQTQKIAYPEVLREAREDTISRPAVALERALAENNLFGQDLKSVPRIREDSIPEQLRGALPKEFVAKDGLPLGEYANYFGFPSGEAAIMSVKELIDQREREGLTRAAHITQMSKALADRRMREEFGDPRKNALELAMDHVLDEGQFKMLSEEMLRLVDEEGAKRGRDDEKVEIPIDKEMIANYAKDRFNRIAIENHSSDDYVRDAGKAGRAALDALIRKDPTEALKQLQNQTIALHYIKLAEANDKVTKELTKIFDRFGEREVRAIDQEHTDWVHYVMQALGVSRRNPIDLQREIEARDGPDASLRSFVERIDKESAQFFEDNPNLPDDNKLEYVAPFLLNRGFNTTVSKMLPEEALATLNFLKALIHHGRIEKKFTAQEMKIGLDAAIDAFEEQLEEIGRGLERREPQRGALVKGALHAYRTAVATLLPIEDIFNRIDRGDPNGLFRQGLLRAIFDADGVRSEMREKYGNKWKEIAFPSKEEMERPVDNPLQIPDQARGGRPREFTFNNVLSMLQNMGNKSNRDIFFRGHEIADRDAFLNWLYSVTTKEDWDRAQKIGDLHAELFEQAANMYRQLTGIAPERIELEPFVTPYGTYRGWYHRIQHDPERPGDAIPKRGPMDDGSFLKAAPSSSYRVKRTGYAAPLLLDMHGITNAMDMMINDIAMRPAVTEAYKVFSNKRFKAAFSRNMGKEMEALLIPWLKDVAGQRRPSDQAASLGNKLISMYRRNIISDLIGMNPVTVMKHFPSAVALGIRKEPGTLTELKNLITQGIGGEDWRFANHGGRVIQNGIELPFTGSTELKNRRNFHNRGLAYAERSAFEGENWQDQFRYWWSRPIAVSDQVVSTATWLATYKRRIREGATHGDAVADADMNVRMTHGTTSIAGRPRILRTNSLAALSVPFYTFFNRMFVGMYEMGWRANEAIGYINKGEKEAGLQQLKMLVPMAFVYIALPNFVEAILDPITTDKDSTSKKILKYGLRAGAINIPLLRDAAEAALGGHEPSMGLFSTGMVGMYNLIRDFGHPNMGFDRQHAGKTIRDMFFVIGMLSSFTNAQFGKWAEYAYNVEVGRDRAKNAADLWNGFLHGQTKWYKKPR